MGQIVNDAADDRALLARIAQGDQDALARLYARYRPRLWRYLWQRLDGQAGWAGEAVQDCFVAAWNTAPTFRGEAQVATWLFRIAHHTAQRAWRDRQRHGGPPIERTLPMVDLPDAAEAMPALDSPEDAIITRLIVTDALADLSAKHREALELVFLHGFTQEEAAAILEVPLGTIKSRLSYARRAMQRSLIAAQDPEEARHDA
jgi:RNA polymerase sigma-70 factor (ECF subfamily)